MQSDILFALKYNIFPNTYYVLYYLFGVLICEYQFYTSNYIEVCAYYGEILTLKSSVVLKTLSTLCAN